MLATPILVKMKEVAPMEMIAKDTVAGVKTAILENIVTQVNVIHTFLFQRLIPRGAIRQEIVAPPVFCRLVEIHFDQNSSAS